MIKGKGFRVKGLGFKVQGLGFEVWILGCGVLGQMFWVYDLWFRA